MTLDQMKELTSKAKDGDGAFDALMRAFQEHIQEEYRKGRIKGSDYAEVYLGGMNSIMGLSAQYLLQKEQSDKQVELLGAQKLQTEEQTKLIAAQKLGVDAEVLQTQAQTDNLIEQRLLIQEQVASEQLRQTKLTADTQLTNEQKAQIVAQTALTNQQLINTVTQNTQLEKQNTKIDAEVALLGQKLDTEKAQILDNVNGAPVAGTIGRQNELYVAQRDGFERDAEQKMAKLMVDSFAVRLTQDNTTPMPSSLADTNFNSVLQKAVAGIGA